MHHDPACVRQDERRNRTSHAGQIWMTTPDGRTAPYMELPRLRRIRWAVRATLLLGVAASVVANVLHARDNRSARRSPRGCRWLCC